MPLGTQSINAITFFTADMASSVRFYEALGFDVVFGGPFEPFTSMAGLRDAHGNATHFVNLQLQSDFVAQGLWGRVIFHTATLDGVDQLHDAAIEAGFTPEMAPSDAPWGERYFHLRDPSGHELSFAHRLDAH